jgi:non-specific serine/threonine protein kinase
LTSFIGREKEMAHVRQLVASTRLLTLTGAGGCGKTRLALQVTGGMLDDYPDGVRLVELAALSDAAHIPRALADVLAVKEGAGRDLGDAVTECLEDKRLLLVLDNAEHLIEGCSLLVDRLVRRCRRLTVLVTSRERLNIPGEVTYRVPSLSVPDVRRGMTTDDILACEAARLFIDRARLQRPDLAVTSHDAPALAAICRRLDGIALAIELAAPRLRAMSLGELSARLDDKFALLTGGPRTALPRHRTLRSLIDWSHDLLGEREKAMLRRASVFAGGWTIEAAERICCDERVACREAVDLLASLVDKNLVVVADTHGQATRFGMLETVRHYAQDRLRESGEEPQVRARHVEYFVDAAEKLAAQQSDADRQMKLGRMDKELDNLRTALAWCENTAPCALRGLRLAGKLYWLWRVQGHFTEGRNWITRLLAANSRGERTKDHATALTTAGILAYLQGDYAAAAGQWEEALAIRRRLGQRRHVAVLLCNLGSVALVSDDDVEQTAARALYEEALSISRELGDRRSVALTLQNLGLLAADTGDRKTARSLLEESVSISREFGDLRAAETLAELGKIKHVLGDDRGARTDLMEALAREQEFGDLPGRAKVLVWLGIVSHDEGDVFAARAQFGEALRVLKAVGDWQSIATALEAIGCSCLESNGSRVAARIWGRAQRLRDELNIPRTFFEVKRYEDWVSCARSSQHDDGDFDRAWHEGQSLTVDEMIQFSMSLCEPPLGVGSSRDDGMENQNVAPGPSF